MRYSQNDEEDVILEWFNGRTGTLLDIGAYDGITFSNTRKLLEKGWNGYLVEPDPNNVRKILDNPPPNAEVVMAAVGRFECMMHITIENHKDRGWASSLHYGPQDTDRILKPESTGVMVSVQKIGNLFPGIDFKFISIDAEGWDLDIMQTIPAGMIAPLEMLCVEPKDKNERIEMKRLAAAFGFKPHHETPENLLLVRA